MKKTTRKTKRTRKPLTAKSRKAKAAQVEIDRGEEIAMQDFRNEEKLGGWQAILKTWTKGQIARFKAAKYVADLANRIRELKKNVAVSENSAII